MTVRSNDDKIAKLRGRVLSAVAQLSIERKEQITLTRGQVIAMLELDKYDQGQVKDAARHAKLGGLLNVTVDGVVAGVDANDTVVRVFKFWRKTCQGGNKRFKLTAGRMSKIRARLKEGFSEKELFDAATGIMESDFHTGANENKTKYIDIQHVYRNAESVERFKALVPSSEPSSAFEQAKRDAQLRRG